MGANGSAAPPGRAAGPHAEHDVASLGGAGLDVDVDLDELELSDEEPGAATPVHALRGAVRSLARDDIRRAIIMAGGIWAAC